MGRVFAMVLVNDFNDLKFAKLYYVKHAIGINSKRSRFMWIPTCFYNVEMYFLPRR